MFRKFLGRLEENILCILLVVMTLLVFSEVIVRFGFNSGIHWAQDATLTVASWIVLLGASYGIKTGGHIGVDAFIKMLSPQKAKIVTVFSILICFIYCALFAYGSWVYLAKLYMIGIDMNDIPIQRWIPTSPLFFCFILLSIRLAILLKKVIKGEVMGFNLVDEAQKSMELAQDIEEDTPEQELKNAAQKGSVETATQEKQ